MIGESAVMGGRGVEIDGGLRRLRAFEARLQQFPKCELCGHGESVVGNSRRVTCRACGARRETRGGRPARPTPAASGADPGAMTRLDLAKRRLVIDEFAT
jgi:hypothetical protein